MRDPNRGGGGARAAEPARSRGARARRAGPGRPASARTSASPPPTPSPDADRAAPAAPTKATRPPPPAASSPGGDVAPGVSAATGPRASASISASVFNPMPRACAARRFRPRWMPTLTADSDIPVRAAASATLKPSTLTRRIGRRRRSGSVDQQGPAGPASPPPAGGASVDERGFGILVERQIDRRTGRACAEPVDQLVAGDRVQPHRDRLRWRRCGGCCGWRAVSLARSPPRRPGGRSGGAGSRHAGARRSEPRNCR